MSNHKDRLADYVEVPDRIKAFTEKYPEGSLQREEWHIETIGDQTFIVYTAKAFRNKNDHRPGVGTAWEPFPGKTPYTRDSELMNAETSAWGRALAALGFIGKKIASVEEVKARQVPEPKATNGNRAPAGTVEKLVEEIVKSKITWDEQKLMLAATGVSAPDEKPATLKAAQALYSTLTPEQAELALKFVTNTEKAA